MKVGGSCFFLVSSGRETGQITHPCCAVTTDFDMSEALLPQEPHRKVHRRQPSFWPGSFRLDTSRVLKLLIAHVFAKFMSDLTGHENETQEGFFAWDDV